MSTLKDLRLKKLEAKYKINLRAEGDHYYDKDKQYYNYLEFFDFIVIKKIFNIEFSNAKYTEYKLVDMFFIHPAYDYLTSPLNNIQFKDYIFNILNLKKYNELSPLNVQQMFDVNYYFDINGKIFFRDYYYLFIDYIINVFFIKYNLGIKSWK